MTSNEIQIRFRDADIDDLALLNHWDQQQHVIDCDPNDDWNWKYELTRDPHWREQLVAEVLVTGMLDAGTSQDDEYRPVGFVQIIDPTLEETHYWGDIEANLRALDIWIGEEADLDRGYGSLIMAMAIERCFNDESVKRILVDPLSNNTDAHRFYERLGFKFIEERTFDEDHCFVYALDKTANQ